MTVELIELFQLSPGQRNEILHPSPLMASSRHEKPVAKTFVISQ